MQKKITHYSQDLTNVLDFLLHPEMEPKLLNNRKAKIAIKGIYHMFNFMKITGQLPYKNGAYDL